MGVGLAAAINQTRTGRWRDVDFTEDRMTEIRYAGLLHELGLACVRHEVVVKAKKLHEWQIDAIKLRFGYVRKAMEAEHQQRRLQIALSGERDQFIASVQHLDAEFRAKLVRLDENLRAVIRANEPTPLAPETRERLIQIADLTYMDAAGQISRVLEDSELQALLIPRGSLTDQERREIQSAPLHTFRLLSLMPWPDQFRDLPIIASSTHERLNGKGYPQAFAGEQIPIQARMLAIACIYDSLTAADRPLKRALPVDKSLDILRQEAGLNNIDHELLDVFIEKRVFDIAMVVAEQQTRTNPRPDHR